MLTMATEKDLDRLEQLYKASIGLPGCTWSDEYPTRGDAAADIAAANLWVVRNAAGQVIAALSAEADEVKQFDFCKDKTSPSIEISRVVVARDQQGRGLAKAMVTELKDVMRSRGYQYIRLLVSPGNKPAMTTYLSAGWQPIGECDLYDTHWLACELKL